MNPSVYKVADTGAEMMPISAPVLFGKGDEIRLKRFQPDTAFPAKDAKM